MFFRPILMTCLLLLAAGSPLAAQDAAGPRTWTDVTGKFKIEAEFVSLANEQVTLKKADGTTITLPLAKLGFADRKLAIQMSKGPPPIPKSAVPEKNPAGVPVVPALPPGKKPDVVISADLLVPEFNANRQKTREKYNGKILEVTGKVKSVLRDIVREGGWTYGLQGGNETLDTAFVDLKGNPLAMASPGQMVTVRGTFEVGDVGAVPTLREGAIVSVQGTGAPELKLKDLAQQYGANPEQFKQAFDKKWFFVSGTVGTVVNDADSGDKAIQVQEGKLKLTFILAFTEEELAKTLKAGSPFRLLVQFDADANEDPGVFQGSEGIVLPEGGRAAR